MIRFRGFTLIELIVVMGILAILATIVVIAVNPGRQFAASRNAKRVNDTRAIAQAINQHTADSNGQTHSSITTTPKIIGTTGSAGYIDLSSFLVPTYLSAIPTDPQGGSTLNTKYTVFLNANNQVVVNATTIELNKQANSEGIGNYGAAFDGTDDYITIPHHSSMTDMAQLTVELWVKVNAHKDYNFFVSKNNHNAGYSLYSRTSGIIIANLNTTSGNIQQPTSSNAITPGTWTHVALVYDGATLRIYVNGTQSVSVAKTGTVSAPTSTLTFGNQTSLNSTYYLNGSLDEVRISNIARYTSSFTPERRFSPDASTVGLWHFDEGGGLTTTDVIGNFIGTFTNGPLWASAE